MDTDNIVLNDLLFKKALEKYKGDFNQLIKDNKKYFSKEVFNSLNNKLILIEPPQKSNRISTYSITLKFNDKVKIISAKYNDNLNFVLDKINREIYNIKTCVI
jgi:hypothetical protein